MAAIVTATETSMFIPNYQIHNILKDFTLQLKKWRQRNRPLANREEAWPVPMGGPNRLRLAAVAHKVAQNIMERIASLGQEAGTAAPAETGRPPRNPDEGFKCHPEAFDYYLLDREKGKVKQRLVVKDSRQLLQRFQTLTAADESVSMDEP